MRPDLVAVQHLDPVADAAASRSARAWAMVDLPAEGSPVNHRVAPAGGA